MTKWALGAFATLLLSGCSTLPLSQDAYEAVSAGALNGYQPVSHYELGKSSLNAHNYGLAITAFQQELDRNPNSVEALNGLAIAYTQLGREDVANDYWERAIALDRHSPITLNNLAHLNLTRGDSEAALAYANEAKTEVAAIENLRLKSSIMPVIAGNIAAASGQPAEDLSAPGDSVLSGETVAQPTNGVEKIGEDEWQLRTKAEPDGAPAALVRTVVSAPTQLARTIVVAPLEPATVTNASPQPEIVVAPTVQTAALNAPIEPTTTVTNASPAPTSVVTPTAPTQAAVAALVTPATTGASAPVEPAGTGIAPRSNIAMSDDISLRISNGAGRDDMAHRFAGFISEQGVAPNLIANARSFDYKISCVFYNPGLLDAAQKIAGMMPIPVRLIEAKGSLGNIEVILGSDLLAFDDGLQGA